MTLEQSENALFWAFFNNPALQRVKLIATSIVGDGEASFVHCIVESNGVRDSVSIDVDGNILA